MTDPKTFLDYKRMSLECRHIALEYLHIMLEGMYVNNTNLIHSPMEYVREYRATMH